MYEKGFAMPEPPTRFLYQIVTVIYRIVKEGCRLKEVAGEL
jgi:hypothetical protein